MAIRFYNKHSEDSMLFKGGGARDSVFDFLVHQIISGCFLEGDDFPRDLSWHNHHAVGIPKNQITRLDRAPADFHRAAVIHHLCAHCRILGEPPPAEDRPILLQHTRRVPVKPIDDRAHRAACERWR